MLLFQKLYKQLNVKQKEAVDAIEGPVMVVAGPGTGKTQILTLRIANILRKTDVSPENILALTFTEAAALSMKRRLAEIIGSEAYSVAIKTFHGFANDIIKQYPDDFPRIIGADNIDELKQMEIIEKIINNLSLKILKPFGDLFYYARPILSNIDKLKREGISVSEFEAIINQKIKEFNAIDDLHYEKGRYKGKMRGKYQQVSKTLNKNQELAEIYRHYQQELLAEKLYDYNDMIMEALEAISKKEDVLLDLQEQYQYILIDEHQDTNGVQNKLMELLGNFHSNPNIFAVGDEKQAIYRFQGAMLGNFDYFKKLYPKAKLIILEDNYRSCQRILDLAHSLIPGPKKLQACCDFEGKKGMGVFLYEFSNSEAENYFIAQDIKDKINKGVLPKNIAILFRDNKDAFPVAAMLNNLGLPFYLESEKDIFSDNDLRKILLLLEAIKDFGGQDKIIEAMHIDFLNIAPLDIYKILDWSKSKKESVYNILRSNEILDSLSLDTLPAIQSFYKKISQWVIAARNENLDDLFARVVRESDFLSFMLCSANSADRLFRINKLFKQIKIFMESGGDRNLDGWFSYLSRLKRYGIGIKQKSSVLQENQVRLMTAHKAKGLEFDYVYIINAFDGHWGNKKKRDPLPLCLSWLNPNKVDCDNNDEERRLFYVALTRAKKNVIISYAKESDNKGERLLSRFVREMKVEKNDSFCYEKDFIDNKEIAFSAPKFLGASVKDKKFVKTLFLKQGFSVTALNNYLRCPWMYFYNNLLTIPRAKSKYQIYGTAIHEALNVFFNSLNNNLKKEKKFLLDKFEFFLKRKLLADADSKELLEKGKKALSGYYDIYSSFWIKDVQNEFNIKEIDFAPGIILKGKIDKIEFLKQVSGNSVEVNVVDYKTGKPKSRKEIEGLTKDSRGDIKRQLIFYNLLLNRWRNGRFKMISGEIDFVEPNERGYYKKEKFIILQEEIKDLEDLIKKSAAEITELSFWDKRCKEKNCEFCELREMM